MDPIGFDIWQFGKIFEAGCAEKKYEFQKTLKKLMGIRIPGSLKWCLLDSNHHQ